MPDNTVSNGIDRQHPAYASEIQRIALAICNGNADCPEYQEALVIAECSVLLRCIDNERVLRIERLRDATVEPGTNRKARFAPARARFREAQIAYEELARLGGVEPGGPAPDKAFANLVWELPPERTEYQAFIAALPFLDRLTRYERRARSRQRRAFKELIEVRSRSVAV